MKTVRNTPGADPPSGVPPGARRPGLATRAAAVLGALGALAAVGSLAYEVISDQSGGGPEEPSAHGPDVVAVAESASSASPDEHSHPAAGESPEAGGDAAARASGTALAVGDCLTADHAVVDCLGEHTAQVVSTGIDCDPSSIGGFLGIGDSDVLRPDLVVDRVQDSPACAVSLAGGAPLHGDLAGAFSDPVRESADQVRHCVDSDGRTVACSEHHRGEVVGSADEAAQCPDVALRYLGWSGPSLPRSLTIEATTGATVECRIMVKGDNMLTTSLRGIGRGTLPIAPAG